MRQVAGFCASWALYFAMWLIHRLGLIAWPVQAPQWAWRLYLRLGDWSFAVQLWGGDRGPWKARK